MILSTPEVQFALVSDYVTGFIAILLYETLGGGGESGAPGALSASIE